MEKRQASTEVNIINTLMQMREIIKILEKAGDDSKRIRRDAFLYMDPRGDEDQFAQCGTCTHWIPGAKRCKLFGTDDVVIANATCGLYSWGEPSDDQEPISSVTPEEAGYLTGQVRCENCSWFADGECGLFTALMDKMSDVFDLEPEVSAKGCCNAWQSA